MHLSEHFELQEFEHGAQVPSDAIHSFLALCCDLLEPIRETFDCPMQITSGYRTPDHNEAVGGVGNSQHIATADHCACDFMMGRDLQVVFDWIRLSSGLDFDQLILERDKSGEPACIHISWSKEPRRMALEGMTHGQSGYKQMSVGGAVKARAVTAPPLSPSS